MPIPVTCAHCGASAQLADNWPHPGFTCPVCRRASQMPTPPAPADEFAFDDSPARSSRRTYAAAPPSAFSAGFGVGSGIVVGGCLALIAISLVMTVFCAGWGQRIGKEVVDPPPARR